MHEGENTDAVAWWALQVELRISQESLRRCDERLRGVLKERQDMESRLRRASSR